jgi:hypoxanthine phosphoribosyltransferase
MNQINVKDKKFELYLSYDIIQKRITEIARDLSIQLKEKDPLFVGILNGSFMFASDLLRQLSFDARITFLKLASYQGTKTTGTVTQLIGLNQSIIGEHVVILEDIIDTGLTIEHIINQLSEYKPTSVSIVTLLLKSGSYQKDIKIDYVGFEVPNDFIVGFGLDYEGYGRNYRDIYKVID